MLRFLKLLILAVVLLSALLLSFGSDWKDTLGSLFQSITPRKGSAPSSYTMETGLVGHWTFDGKDTNWTANTTQDKSGSGNTGTMTSMSTTTSPVPGKLGQGFDFDGVNDYVDLGNAKFDLPVVTACAWFKTRGQLTTGDARIITSGSENTNQWTLNISQAGGDFGRVVMVGDPALHVTPSSNPPRLDDSLWHHACGVNNPETIYIDGILQTGTVTDSWSFEANAKIGSRGTLRHFPGTLDDVRVYNRVLSADEVKQLYLQGSSLKTNITPRKGSAPPSYTLESGLVGHWTFDGKDTAWNSNTTQDKSGQGNTGGDIVKSCGSGEHG